MSWISAFWNWYSAATVTSSNAITHPHAELVNPIGTFIGTVGTFVSAAILAWAAVRNSRATTRQAEVARQRHVEQTNADRQRRLTESFSKAVEQLTSKEMVARLGGIYTLERVSRESVDDYWTVMETLTAFVRHSARYTAPETTPKEMAVPPDLLSRPTPSTDIAAVLTVLTRRSDLGRKQEQKEGLRLSLSNTDLRGASLAGAHLDEVDLGRACLETAQLKGARLKGANLTFARLAWANLQDADLSGAYLNTADLRYADLQKAQLNGAILPFAQLTGAVLAGAHLKGAFLRRANLTNANVSGAHVEGANLTHVSIPRQTLEQMIGDSHTILDPGIDRPESWSMK